MIVLALAKDQMVRVICLVIEESKLQEGVAEEDLPPIEKCMSQVSILAAMVITIFFLFYFPVKLHFFAVLKGFYIQSEEESFSKREIPDPDKEFFMQ